MHLSSRLLTWPILLAMTGCVPRIEIATPKEPITINMNVHIEHDINIKADQASEKLLSPQRRAEQK
ncbi:YnbE family lipoprotein [Biostraticola tofi]|uniref:YnbE-like lipoprotein n=1 Tax=Biostraticola tofi TaxID=466109 RepID=A0A4V2W5H5_9GAMM|nr:YnbE family lipoprotein [Biostraticola tofi]TCV99845.1 YnbE-like lipoprotein [Biostraticola tofi]